jgi:tetratricopeptide (TPR) repeat protein
MLSALFCFCLSFSLSAQHKTIADGELYFNNGQYGEAIEIYTDLLKKNPKNLLLKYKYARCCYELGLQDEAIQYFLESDPKLSIRNYYLGNLYFDTYQFEEAAIAYENYLETLSENDEKWLEIHRKVRQARTAADLITRVEDIAIIDSITVDKRNFLSYYRMNYELGALEQDSILVNGVATDRVFYTTQRRDRLYFSDENKGQLDIFSSYKLLNGWSKAIPVGEGINSLEANENYPFLMPDGITIYFASDREGSIGGYDIFASRYVPSENRYFAPENVGMPFNSPYNDYMMVIDEASKTGCFATDRYMAEGKLTIYLFALNESKKIIRPDDRSYIREAARLKTFRKAPKPSSLSFLKNDETPQETDENSNTAVETEETNEAVSAISFEFFITGDLTYTHISQFKSKKSLQSFAEFRSLTSNLANMKKELEELRKEYAGRESAEARAELAPKILKLETSVNEHAKHIKEKELQIRNEEIKQISLQQ